MFHQEEWFAWFPVVITTHEGKRLAWLETVVRERHALATFGGWRYYAAT